MLVLQVDITAPGLCGTRGGTQGFADGRRALYQLSYSPSPITESPIIIFNIGKSITFIYLQCVRVEVRGQFLRLVLTFHHVGPGDLAEVVRLAGKCLYPLSHPAGPLCFYLDLANICFPGFSLRHPAQPQSPLNSELTQSH